MEPLTLIVFPGANLLLMGREHTRLAHYPVHFSQIRMIRESLLPGYSNGMAIQLLMPGSPNIPEINIQMTGFLIMIL